MADSNQKGNTICSFEKILSGHPKWNGFFISKFKLYLNVFYRVGSATFNYCCWTGRDPMTMLQRDMRLLFRREHQTKFGLVFRQTFSIIFSTCQTYRNCMNLVTKVLKFDLGQPIKISLQTFNCRAGNFLVIWEKQVSPEFCQFSSLIMIFFGN